MGNIEEYCNAEAMQSIGTILSIFGMMAMVFNISTFIVLIIGSRSEIISITLVLYELVSLPIYFIIIGFYITFYCLQRIKDLEKFFKYFKIFAILNIICALIDGILNCTTTIVIAAYFFIYAVFAIFSFIVGIISKEAIIKGRQENMEQLENDQGKTTIICGQDSLPRFDMPILVNRAEFRDEHEELQSK
ncbi:unnamed protein product [Chironomus riparius]|uniref:Uncharacterized protein n=1 Tax=Chironomus riparius TaxID=315576 RepID=A0A9N9SAI9_9DIPT|nr:unnamed protein product [Chironomus riparius]